jgi:two-component system, OmpR family, phosphate regulon sensor histidine kinase PhoR
LSRAGEKHRGTLSRSKEYGMSNSGQRTASAGPADGKDFYTVLLAMAGHDMRNKLQAIGSAHRGLEKHLPEGPEKLYLELGKVAVAQLSHQLDEILDALRLYQDNNELSLEPVALAPILSALDREMIEPAWRKNVEFEVGLIREHVLSNANLLASILRNLAHNAIKFTPAGGRVSVVCDRHDETISIAVHDTGIGIAPEQQARIFDAFYRIESGTGTGLGLGLFIARRAADLLRHGIEVRSQPDKGSCFLLTAEAAGPGRSQR